MSALLSPTPVFKAFDNNGAPLAFGQLTSFAAGTTTNQPTYVDSTLTTQNTNPIVLNSRGECNLWLDPSLSYKFKLTDSFGNTIWTVDNVQGASTILFPDGTAAVPAIAFAADPNTGIYRPGSDTIGFATGGFKSFQVAGGPSSSTTESLNAAAGQTVSLTLNGNGVSDFSGAFLQQNAAGNFRVKNGVLTGSTIIGAGGNDVLTVSPTSTVSVAGVDFTPSTGTFVLTLTGCTTSPTVTATYYKIGQQVTMYVPGTSATSNATTCTLTGLPSNLQPPTAGQINLTIMVVDSGAVNAGYIQLGAGTSTMTLFKGNTNSTTSFTNTGTKGYAAFCLTYLLV